MPKPEPSSAIDELIAHILKQRKAGWDLSLERIIKLLAQLGNPQEKLPPPIHIAGTNGKGSTASFCRALLEASGHRVHVFSSPHLVSWRERFRLNGALISEAALCNLLREIIDIADKEVTLFEILTAAAMLEFARTPADATIFEVGLGGRLDATNVIARPACSIITPISYDHCAMLGAELAQIAAEKAAIIKPNCEIVVAKQNFAAAEEVIVKQARACQAKLSLYGQDFFSYSENGRMIFQNQNGLMDLAKPGLPGEHQLVNAATAIEAVGKLGIKLTQAQVEKALQNSYWPGRLQKITNGTLYNQTTSSLASDPAGDLAGGLTDKAMAAVATGSALLPSLQPTPPLSSLQNFLLWLDGAHNEAGAAEVARFFNQSSQKIILIVGMLETKDPASFLGHFTEIAEHCCFVPIEDSAKAWRPEQLQQACTQALQAKSSFAPSLPLALQQAASHLGKAHNIVVTGSLHLVGEFLRLNETPPL